MNHEYDLDLQRLVVEFDKIVMYALMFFMVVSKGVGITIDSLDRNDGHIALIVGDVEARVQVEFNVLKSAPVFRYINQSLFLKFTHQFKPFHLFHDGKKNN